MKDGWTTYRFRFIRATWGIAIDMRARAVEAATDGSSGVRQIGLHIYLDVTKAGLTDIDRDELARGLSMVAEQVEDATERRDVLIEVASLTYPLTEYQPEGVAATAAGWAVEYFGLDEPSLNITFNHEENRYVFKW